MAILRKDANLHHQSQMGVSGNITCPICQVIKKVLKLVGVLALLMIVLAVIPIKFSEDFENISKSRTYFIVQRVSSGSTDGGVWLCIGNNNGFFEKECYVVTLGGNSPARILSEDIYENGKTIFALYAEENSKIDFDGINYIYCYKWDFVGDISRSSESLRIPYNKYITIYDLKLWDYFLHNKNKVEI